MPFWDRNKDEEATQTGYIWNRVLAVILIFMAGSAALFGVYSVFASSSLFIPKGADGVLKSVDESKQYAWSSESIRLYEAGGTAMRQDSARGAIVDLVNNKFQLQTAGILPKRTYYASDGKFALRLTEDQDEWTQITDACNKADTIPASKVKMPSPKDLREADPSMLTDEGTFLGDRAWVIKFKMTPTIMKQLLMVDLFSQASKSEPEHAWVISESERTQIEKGEMDTVDALAWVNRDGDRQIQQIDARVKLKSGTRFRFLAQRVAGTDNKLLDELNFGKPTC